MDNESLFDNNQFVVSYELLLLLQWLVDNNPEALNDIVQNALNNGLHEEILHAQDSARTVPPNNIELQQSIIDFFVTLETCLEESPQSTDDDIRRVDKLMIPAIDQIDSHECDEGTLAMSVAEATSSLQENNTLNAKEALCRQILKNWNPHCCKNSQN